MKGWKGFRTVGSEVLANPRLDKEPPKNIHECIDICLDVPECTAANFGNNTCMLIENIEKIEADPNFMTAFRCHVIFRFELEGL